MNEQKRIARQLAKITLVASARIGHTWLTMAGPSTIEGVPHQRFRKSVMRIGKFVKDSEGLEFEVTASTLANWANQFRRMKSNGVKVPIPNMHANDGNADQNRGYVDDLFVDGDELVMLCNMIGEDAIAAAARSDVSIKSPSHLVDGEGHEYIRPIVHIALCTDPVISGLGDFVPIAASQKKAAEKESEMTWTEVQKALGSKETVTDENASELICSRLADLDKQISDLEGTLNMAKNAPDKKLKDDEKGEDEDKRKLSSDPLVVNLVCEARGLKLQRLVDNGKMIPAQLKALTRYTDPKLVTLELQSGGRIDEFDKLLEVMDMREPVVLGEHTGQQVLELARSIDGSDGSADAMLENAKARRKTADALMQMSH